MLNRLNRCPRAALALMGFLLIALAAACTSAEPEVVIKEIPKEVVVEKEIIKEVPVEVVKTVEVVKEVPVEVVVEKEIIKQVPVEVVVEKVVVKEVPVEVVKEVIKEVPVEVEVVKEVIVEVPGETVVKEVVKEVPIETTMTVARVMDQVVTHGIAAGARHTCALKENGEAVCWGSNEYGQSDAPAGRFAAIVAGSIHTCALRDRGEAVCWGYNDDGRANAPSGRFTAISAGAYHNCALRENGEAVCWGLNDYGQSYAPSGIFTAISAGHNNSCGLRENGDPECWGANVRKTTDVRGHGFVAISPMNGQTCALRNDGSGACWTSDAGESLAQLSGPLMVMGSNLSGHGCALRENGEAVCWGDNDYNQLLAPGGRFTAISAGYYHTCGLRENGEAVCWGDDDYGKTTPPRGVTFVTPSSDWFSRVAPSGGSFDAASVLARFSTSDAVQGERRAAASSAIVAQYTSGDVDEAQILDLLHTMAPELSLSERRQAADALAALSDDGEWDDAETLAAVNHLAGLVTGNAPNPQERIAAANQMVTLYKSGDLTSDNAVSLLNIIAPGLAINERRQAAASLARLAADTDWSDEGAKLAAANEAFRLVTGVPLNAQARLGAAVDLAGIGVKVFSGGSIKDSEVKAATTIIKQGLSGNLTAAGIRSILGF